ncbi:MAG: SDR family oxidoreductase [Clostridia bacterium]|nr:SDR family oxidoreductase [Clostridia bacterium]
MKKTIVISGASGGIGNSLVNEYVKNNYFVIGLYNSNDENINTLRQKYSNKEAFFYKCDFSKIDTLENTLNNILSPFSKIDTLINNAGIDSEELFTETQTQNIINMFNINLISSMILTKIVLRKMLHYKEGNIINISSIWGLHGGSCEVVYSTTKGGLISFTKSLAKEVGLSSIRVNCLVCGMIDTKMNDRYSNDEKLDFLKNTSLNRIGKPEEVAKACLFLSEDTSSYITGQIISIDGGLY